MFLLRPAKLEDVEELYGLSKLVQFINLPRDINNIEKKVETSIQSFQGPSDDFSKNYYIFVLEDLEKSSICGTSMIHARHGSESEPHFYLKVGQERRYSETLNTGFIHGTLKLGVETNGHSEIGGIVLHPEYRGHPEKLGKLLSLSRFMYMGQFPERFTELVHAELMPPLDENGNSPLWEAIGRKFFNMDYHEADLLSLSNKEFLLNLFPAETIYQNMLPMEAREAIGKVGEETMPVKKMLEKIGLKYTHEVDPFDGGPHYRGKLTELSVIKNMICGSLNLVNELDRSRPDFLVANGSSDLDFFVFKSKCHIDSNKRICLPSKLKNYYEIKESQKICVSPF